MTEPQGPMEEPRVLQLNLETDDEPENNRLQSNNAGRYRPPRPSALPRKSMLKGAAGGHRSRRRSSARFLSIGGRQNPDEDLSHESLGKMYKQAIKMNAENRINASNSWNFKLIENIDKFLTEEPEDAAPQRSISHTPSERQLQEREGTDSSTRGGRRVNFTKASCTLDASVKIYSYRVDDVHLTSYRVLENLHRSDGDKKKKGQDRENSHPVDTEEAPGRSQASNRSRAATSTIETNLANINLNKLDSAFDIDPLFHKMSKTFDEGGAKGLLLVNLGTGGNGCNIVFDSGLADEEEESKAEDNAPVESNTTLDISSLTTKLDSLLSGQSVHSLPLVPQLAGLRAEYATLEQEGFVEQGGAPVNRSRRFAPDPNEEKEADQSIHHDAMERSRASMGRSVIADEEDLQLHNEQEYAADDFGGFDDDDDDAFDAFIAADGDGQRYSSISFHGAEPLVSQESSATTVLLDAISAGQVLGESEFEFFDSQMLSHVAANAWAGSAHWKPLAHLHKPKAPKETKKTKEKRTTRKRATKERSFVDLQQEKPDLTDILRKPPKPKGRRAQDPLQYTAASITKYTKNDNLLPPDAGIRPDVLSSLFLRPNAVLKQATATPTNNTKAVGFAMDQIETFGADAWDDGSFGGGDDDDGPGFAMSGSIDEEGDNEFVVEELEGVRKVDKVTVGYATIAKKVDVKRLKHDLWDELECHLMPKNKSSEEDDQEDEEMEEFPTTPTASELSGPLSFRNTVQTMEAKKTQLDVTLPFYFICLLHLANEKGLRLDSKGLDDFEIHSDGAGSFF